MMFHGGDKRLEKEELIQVTKWINNLGEISFAIGLLERDKIPWMICSIGSRYALFRQSLSSIFLEKERGHHENP